MKQLGHIESICHHYFLNLLLSFYFLTMQVNLYMIHLYLNLFYEVYNAINQQYQKQVNSIFLLILLEIFSKEIQKII